MIVKCEKQKYSNFCSMGLIKNEAIIRWHVFGISSGEHHKKMCSISIINSFSIRLRFYTQGYAGREMWGSAMSSSVSKTSRELVILQGLAFIFILLVIVFKFTTFLQNNPYRQWGFSRKMGRRKELLNFPCILEVAEDLLSTRTFR